MRTIEFKNISARSFLKPLALMLCVAAFTSCQKTINEVPVNPTPINSLANFDIVKDPNDAFKFTFKNLSAKYKKLEWRFGDDTLTSVIDPVHIYAKPGKYTVDLKTFSETGGTSRKLVEINIQPDSVLKINVEKTGVTNQVRYSISAKAPIASVLWTFGDVSPAATSTALTPERTYAFGTFNQVTAQVTTTSGSVVSVSKNNFTTEGAVEDITLKRKSYTVSAENNLAANENSTNLLDNNVETKYTMGAKDGRLFTYPLVTTITYETAQLVKLYALGNSNDLPARDPKSWKVEGSNDGTTWDLLDTRTMAKNFFNQMTDLGATTDAQRYKKLFYYGIATPKAYTRYRFSITANWGDAALQINEFRLYR